MVGHQQTPADTSRQQQTAADGMKQMPTETRAKQANVPMRKMTLRKPAMGGDLITVRFTLDQIKWLQAEAKRLDRPVAWVVRKAVDAMAEAAEELKGE